MWETITGFWNYYVTELQSQWNHMTPMKYGCLLIGVFAFGWLMMKSGIKST